MTARLLAAWAVVLTCLALSTPPAAASCAGDIGAVLEGDPPVVFVGVVERRISDDGRTIGRFRVSRVHNGEVHRMQDVLVPADEVTSAGVDWSEGDRVLVLGRIDEEGQIATNGCMTVTQGSDEYRAALHQLGEGSEPLDGADRVELENVSRRDVRWVRLIVGSVGLAALGVVLVGRLRRRRA